MSLIPISLSRSFRQPVRWQTGVARDAVRCLQAGQQLHGYTVTKVVEIPELFTTSILLQHDKTGAQHLHMARDDDNNAFSVSFRTTPLDNTGVPHILEHTALCGSRKYPVRDPFMKMLSRSLATFMNAFTASDWTMYPFCSQHRQDYNNLLSVYLDAVFYPQLRQTDFKQEGWRLEHENLQDPSTPLVFKGVVYNEMKGVFSNSQHLFSESVQNKLMPNHTYGVISGGDPAYIPDLSWEKLKEFHASHYHPSNARFYTYGNFPLEEHLSYINSNYLENFQQIPVNTKVPKEKRWTKPRSDHITCQPDPMAPDPDKNTTVAVNFLLSEITDPFEAVTLSIIGTLLVDGETAPFYQSLLIPQIGSSYSPVIGYQGYTYEASFHVGLQGVHPHDVDKVKAIVDSTLDKVIEEGFEQERIDALLHKIELSLKHQTGNFGLHLIVSTASPWNHDGDPTDSLQVNKMVERFKHELNNNPKFLQEKVKQYFKENPHRLTLTMGPDKDFEAKLKKAEQAKLASFTNKLSDEEKNMLHKEGLELLELQMAREDVSCLPTLKVYDMESSVKPEPTNTVSTAGLPLQVCIQPTNEVVYLRMISNMAAVPMELKPYVPLFCEVITKVGAGPYDYKTTLPTDGAVHGWGMNVDTILHHITRNLMPSKQVRFGGVDRRQLITNGRRRLWPAVFQTEDMLLGMTILQKTCSPRSKIEGGSLIGMKGKSQVYGNLESGGSDEEDIAQRQGSHKVIQHFQEIRGHLLNKKQLRDGARRSQSDNIITKDEAFSPASSNTQYELPFSVNYMSKSLQTVPYSQPEHASLKVLSKILSRKYLHREIREKGGAYGGGAVCGNGVFSFFSYRDPNSLQTLEVFDKAVEWSAEGGFTDEDIDEAKLSVFQESDKPVPPGQMGITHFLSGVTDFMRQEQRDRLFAVNRENIVDVTSRFLLPGKSPCSTSFIGPSNEAVSQDDKWTVIKE
ncbi:hypothetical protein ScPMuIL_017246 [Solemya velum]